MQRLTQVIDAIAERVWLSRATRWQSRLSNERSGRGKQICHAINGVAAPTPEEAAWFDRLERLRREMSVDPTLLAAWERPWIDNSAELQVRVAEPVGVAGHVTSMTVAEASRASKNRRWGALLFMLTRHIRPAVVVELGTNLGISGSYFAAALEMNGNGQLITLEGSPSKAARAVLAFEQLRLSHRVEVVVGDFATTLQPTLERTGHVDLAFIDGFHDGTATIQYHEHLKNYASENAVLIYDDIGWSDGMKRAWQVISSDEFVHLALDLRQAGICTFSRSPEEPVRAGGRLRGA